MESMFPTYTDWSNFVGKKDGVQAAHAACKAAVLARECAKLKKL
jgi:hypothetical protein